MVDDVMDPEDGPIDWAEYYATIKGNRNDPANYEWTIVGESDGE